MDLSIVIPIKDEKDNIKRLHERISAALRTQPTSYEIVLVDDGSNRHLAIGLPPLNMSAIPPGSSRTVVTNSN